MFDLTGDLPVIAVAASGPASARIAAELGDGLFAIDPGSWSPRCARSPPPPAADATAPGGERQRDDQVLAVFRWVAGLDLTRRAIGGKHMAKHDTDPVLRHLVRAVDESGQARVPVTVSAHGTAGHAPADDDGPFARLLR